MAKKYKTLSVVSFVWSYARKYRGLFFVVLLMSLLSSFVNAATPYIFGQLIDSFLNKALILGFTLYQVLLIWTVLIIIRIITRKLITRAIVKLEVSVEKDLTSDLIGKIIEIPIKFHYDQKTGEIYKKVERASNAVNESIDSFLFNMTDNVLNIGMALIIMLTISWQLALINFVFIVIFFVFAAVYKMKEILANRKKTNKKYNVIFGNIGDIIANIFSVKVNTAEKHEAQRLNTNYNQAVALVGKQMDLWTNVSLGQSIISNAGTIITVFLGASYMISGNITPGQFATFLLYLSMIYTPIYWMSNLYRQMKRWLVDLDGAQEIINEKKEKIFQKEQADISLQGGIEFRNITFKYPLRNQGILKNVSFKVNQGETLAIFGATGSGKTTIYNLLLRLYDQDSGQIFFDGLDSQKIDRYLLRSQTAIVPQDPSLFNESILYNIKYGKQDATMKEIEKAAKIANAHDFINQLPKGYDTKVGERGVKLSGGQVQRIAIARAALRDPKILILDEATTSLDQKTKFEVLDALRNLIAGRTTIIITHDFSAITQNADHIIVIDKGRIVQQGKHQQLVSQKGIYQELWQTQQKHLQTL